MTNPLQQKGEKKPAAKKKKPRGRGMANPNPDRIPRGKDKKARKQRYSNEQKFEIMHYWAMGNSFDQLHEKFKIHRNTADNWKQADDPQNWEVYRKRITHEAMEEAIHSVKKRYAEVTKHQLEDAMALRNVSKKLLVDLGQELMDPTKDRKLSTSTVKITREIARSLVDAQKMTSVVFGLPTHKVSMEPSGGPVADAMAGRDIDSMSEQELVKQIMDTETNGSGG